jgi:hypothetical protein
MVLEQRLDLDCTVDPFLADHPLVDTENSETFFPAENSRLMIVDNLRVLEERAS